MLEKLGLNDDKEQVEKSWKAFLIDTEIFKPKAYSLLYPDKILKGIVDEFHEFYQNADLASHAELSGQQDPSLSEILNTAWNYAQAAPLDYYKHETDVIKKLKAGFGLPD